MKVLRRLNMFGFADPRNKLELLPLMGISAGFICWESAVRQYAGDSHAANACVRIARIQQG